MSEEIFEKLASKELNPAMQDVVLRAKSAGLHKIAAKLKGKDEFSLRDEILELSTKVAYEYLKQQKIASGMRALRALEASGDIKLAGIKDKLMAAGGTPAWRDASQFASGGAGGAALRDVVQAKPQMRVSDLLGGAPSATTHARPAASMGPVPTGGAPGAALPMGRLPTAP